MRSVLALATIAFTASVAASPWGTQRTTSNCMSDSDATKVATNFQTLIASYSDAFANQTLTVDFVDYSDSVIELINGACTTDQTIPLGSAVFDSRASFESGQGAQPAIPFQILKTWNNCNAVTLRWLSKGPGQEPQQVTGIIVLEVVKNTAKNPPQKWLIKTVYSEFNSGAWLVNLGVFTPTQCPFPPPPSAKSKRSIFV
jgi:hypothetical protein